MPNFIVVQFQISEITWRKETDKHTNRQTMYFINIDNSKIGPKMLCS